MVEVFRTGVQDQQQAGHLTALIQTQLGYRASFDLEDCDRILRVESKEGPVHAAPVLHLLRAHGCEGAVLPDEVSGPAAVNECNIAPAPEERTS